MHLLIVDDEVPLLNVLREKFEKEGFRVDTGKNGEEGLAAALSVRPDLILLDIIMPKMDGMTMLKKLRSTDDWGKKVPVILLTNLTAGADDQIQDVVDTEPSYYLVKSNMSLDQVVEKVRERLA